MPLFHPKQKVAPQISLKNPNLSSDLLTWTNTAWPSGHFLYGFMFLKEMLPVFWFFWVARRKHVPSSVTSITTAHRGKAKAVDPKVILEHHSLFFLGGECLLILSTEHRFFSSPLSVSLPSDLGEETAASKTPKLWTVIQFSVLMVFFFFWSFSR